jgi:hypothetical protein
MRLFDKFKRKVKPSGGTTGSSGKWGDDIRKIQWRDPNRLTKYKAHGGKIVRQTLPMVVKQGKTAWLRSPVKFTPWALAAGAALWGAGHLLKKYGKTKGTVSEGGRRFPVSKGPQDPGMPDKQLKISYEGTPYNPNAEVLGYQMDQDKPKKKKDTKAQPIIKDRYILYGGVRVYPKGRQFRGY